MGSILMIKFRNPMQPPQTTKPSSKLFHAQKHRLPWNQSLTWLPTHRQIHLCCSILHSPLSTFNSPFDSLPLTLTFLLLTLQLYLPTTLPSHFSTLFSSPFNLLSLTLHFSSHIFFAPLQYFSARSHSPFQLSFTQITCLFKNSHFFSFYLFHSPFFWSLLRENLPLHCCPSSPLSFSFSIIFIPTTISLLFNGFKVLFSLLFFIFRSTCFFSTLNFHHSTFLSRFFILKGPECALHLFTITQRPEQPKVDCECEFRGAKAQTQKYSNK